MYGYDIDDKILRKYYDYLYSIDDMLKDISRTEKLHGGNIVYISSDDNLQTPIQNHKSECQILYQDILNYNIDNICVIIYNLASEMISSVKSMVNSSLDTITDFSGNIVDAGGGVLSCELVMKMIDKMHIEFDSNGSPMLPTLFLNGRHISVLDVFPDLTGRFSDEFGEILARKKEQYYAAKGCRRLSRID